jgi:cysteine-S-conjugate beta-lyase
MARTEPPRTLLVPSGLAAVTIPLLAFLSPGDHLLMVDSVYGNTRYFCDTTLKRLGIEVEYYDPLVGAGIEKLIRPNTAVVFTESPGSNTFEIQDIPAIVEKAHAAGAIVMMDNTALPEAAGFRRRYLHSRGNEISVRPFRYSHGHDFRQ